MAAIQNVMHQVAQMVAQMVAQPYATRGDFADGHQLGPRYRIREK